MSGVLRLSNNVTGRSTINASASNDQTYTLPALGGTLVTGGASSELIFPPGTEALPGLHVQGDVDTGLYAPAANTLGISTGGNERLRIDSSGRVGINTTSPTKSLDVNGTFRVVNEATFDNDVIVHQVMTWLRNDGVTDCGSVGNADYLYATGADTDLAIKAETGDITFVTSGGGGLERLRIDSAGNVGIGTASPNANLQVGNYSATTGISIGGASNGYSYLYFADGSSGNQLYRGYLQYYHVDDSLQLGTSGTEQMRIDSSGNLSFSQDASSSPYPEQKLKWSNDSTTTNGFYISQGTDRNGKIWHEQGLDIQFATNNTERMRIDSSGNVGIGTTSPNGYANWRVLTINGTVGGEIDFETNGTNTAQIYSSATSTYINRLSASGDIIFLAGSGVERMRIASTGAIVLPNGSPGIQFGTFSSPVTSTNLDDYEEGTFTPTVQGTATAGTASYTNYWGQYVKVGQLVTAQIYISWNSGTGAGSLRIHDLPFYVNTINNSYGGVAVGYWHLVPLSTNYYPTLFLTNNGNYINCYQAPTGGGSASVVPYPATGGGIIVTVTYRAA